MRALVALVGVLLAATVTLAQDYAAPGKFEVSVTDKSWTDASRQDREVPVRIYAPKDDPAKFPVVIFSHGLGGSREHYVYFSRHMASHGRAQRQLWAAWPHGLFTGLLLHREIPQDVLIRHEEEHESD